MNYLNTDSLLYGPKAAHATATKVK